MAKPTVTRALSLTQQNVDASLGHLKMAQAAGWLLEQLNTGDLNRDELRTYLTHMAVETLVKELRDVRGELEEALGPRAVA